MAAGLRRILATSMVVILQGVARLGQGLAQSDAAPVVRIEMSEYAFMPAQVTLKAGKPVTLTVVNVGRATHIGHIRSHRDRGMKGQLVVN